MSERSRRSRRRRKRLKKIVIAVSEKFHREFKTHCVQRGTTMSKHAKELLAKHLQEVAD